MLAERFDEIIGPDFVLLREKPDGRVHILNRTAAQVWCCLANGMTAAQCAAELSSAFRLDSHRAELDVRSVLEALTRTPETVEVPPFWFPVESSTTTISRSSRTVTFGLGSTSVDLVGAPDLVGSFESLFSHTLRREPASRHHVLELLRAERGLAILKDGAEMSPTFRDEQLVPTVVAALHWVRFHSMPDCMRLHAAAVSKGGDGILICGPSGCGKSTLAAALGGSGFTCMTDDLAQLDAQGRVHALPIALGVKSGSWAMLEPHLGALSSIPSFERRDGKIVKYLTTSLGAPGSTCKVDTILFVSHGASRTNLRELSRFEAIERLSEAGIWVPPAWPLRTFAEWLSRVRAVELTSAALAESVLSVTELA